MEGFQFATNGEAKGMAVIIDLASKTNSEVLDDGLTGRKG